MLTKSQNLKGLVIRSSDGEIGSVGEIYFDDQRWVVRYLTVDTGNWLNGRNVLITPHSILQTDWTTGRIDVSLTRKQIENAPDIDTQRPVSRQQEAEYYGYYGYPYYWQGPYIWGPSYSPGGMVPMWEAQSTTEARVDKGSGDSHLRSTKAVTGYRIQTQDGEIGHIEDFLVDDEAWAIRYLEVDTTNWWPGKKVLLSPDWVESVSWGESKVFVAVTREAIQNCPEYLDSVPVTREYENKLYFHYGQAPYWIEAEKQQSAFAASGA